MYSVPLIHLSALESTSHCFCTLFRNALESDSVNLGFPGLSGKESACQAGVAGLVPRLGRPPGEGDDN